VPAEDQSQHTNYFSPPKFHCMSALTKLAWFCAGPSLVDARLSGRKQLGGGGGGGGGEGGTGLRPDNTIFVCKCHEVSLAEYAVIYLCHW
jgi:hypothetical protein